MAEHFSAAAPAASKSGISGGLSSRRNPMDTLLRLQDDESDDDGEAYTYESDVDDDYEHFLFDYEPPEEEMSSSPSTPGIDSNNGKQQQQQQPATALWQLDPEDSFSDWTIYITTAAEEDQEEQSQQPDRRKTRRQAQQQQEQDQKQDDVYHVHRNILTCGLLQSEYFRMMFQSDFCETKSHTSHIPLVAPAKRAFPLFLNLLYHPTTELSDIRKMLMNKKLTMTSKPLVADDKDDDDDKKEQSASNSKSSNSSPNKDDNNNNNPDDANAASSNLHQLVALLHLADFFQATKLHECIFQVIRKIPFSACLGSRFYSLYRQAAIDFSPPVQVVLDYMQEFCARNIHPKMIAASSSSSSPSQRGAYSSSSSSSSFWSAVSVEFLIGVVSSEHHLQADARLKDSDCYGINVSGLFTGPKRSRLLSDLVARYCWTQYSVRAQKQQQQQAGKKSSKNITNTSSNNGDQDDDDSSSSLVNAETFCILTQKDYLPDISFGAARKLLQLEKYYLGGGNDDQDSKPKAVSTSVTVTPKSASSSPRSSSNSDNGDDELTCLQTRCLTALQNNPELIDTANPSTDKTLKALKTSTLLSPSSLVDFMAKLCSQQVEKCNVMEREIKRFQLLPAREAVASGLSPDNSNNANTDDDNARCMKPIYSCAPERFLPQHLHDGRDHDGTSGCPGHVLSRDRKRVLFTYEPPPPPPSEDDDNDEDDDVEMEDMEGENEEGDFDEDDDAEEADSDDNDDEEEEEEEEDDDNDDEQDDDASSVY